MDMRSSTAMDAWKRKIIAAFIRASIERPMFDPLNTFIKKHNFVATVAMATAYIQSKALEMVHVTDVHMSSKSGQTSLKLNRVIKEITILQLICIRFLAHMC